MKKILLDATFINNGGGIELLDYFVEELHKTELNIFYVFDSRITGRYNFIDTKNKIYLKPSFLARFFFYSSKSFNYDIIFCFNNIPPFPSRKGLKITYFHQRLFLDKLKGVNYFQSLPFRIKKYLVYLLRNNTNLWVVQTDSMKNLLEENYGSNSTILVKPFFRNRSLLYSLEENHKRKFGFVYIGSGALHKNHHRLIDAFVMFYEKYKIGCLVLTISASENPALAMRIDQLRSMKIPVLNYGLVSNNMALELYRTFEFCIHPSTSESFGLGIIESIQCGCKLLAPDLQYIHDICKPSLLFNPFDVNSIYSCMEKASKNKEVSSSLLVENKVNDLILLIKSYE